jgi:ABC transport system ATP-binding/permease protein
MPKVDFKYFADIYIELNKGNTTEEIGQRVDLWSSRYLNSPQYASYIRNTLSPGKENQHNTDTAVKTGISPVKQLVLLSRRYWKLVNRDRASLIISLISAPITIGLTALSLGKEDPLATVSNPDITQASLALRLLFIFSCIAIWIGLSNSIQEIAKESAIYFRERLLNLGLFPYIGSKIAVRGLINFLQTILMAIAVVLAFKSPESDLIPWYLGFAITTFLTLIASTSLSLMISAWVDNENKGNSLLPLVMIPQIILSGVLFDLDGWSSKLSWLMLSRWSVGAYGAIADVNAIAPTVPNLEKIFKPSEVYSANWDNLALNWGILLAHTFTYLIVTLIVQKRKDVF